jgi:basic membrane lipoprotein Med (substrate-binding protein (PBP1-ABC) superfamily)
MDWSDPGEGVQIFSEQIADDVDVVAALPHPESRP